MKNIFKKCIAFVVAGAMTLAFVGTTAFAGDVTQKSITVNGTGIVKVKPDICDISFTVQTNNKASDVQRKINNRANEVQRKFNSKTNELKENVKNNIKRRKD